MNSRTVGLPVLIAGCLVAGRAVAAETPDEFKIKREAVYEFARKPRVSRRGDRVMVSFETKGFCDATVAIENAQGRIVRHLASGVLGKNAPPPFVKNSKKQTVVWDGKNDAGRYIDDKDALTVRVSLGLKARYEKNLFWEPKKRVSRGGIGAITTEDVIPVPRPEGVYVYDGNGVDHLRLFDHEGNYVRTIYPFPAAKLKGVKGLKWREYPHGYSRPAKYGLNQTTFFRSGGVNTKQFALSAAFAMAVQGKRIALVKLRLSRLTTDGSTPATGSGRGGGLDLTGPRTWFDMMLKGKPWDGNPHSDRRCCPYSAAFSPDGRRLYLAGYSNYSRHWGGRGQKTWLGGVTCLDYAGNAAPKIFAGNMKMNAGLTPGVACDKRGRVYVTDYIRDAVDVYDEKGKRLRTVPAKKPVFVSVSPKTGELYVFSWNLNGTIWHVHPGLKGKSKKIPATLTVIKSADDPKRVATYALPRVMRSGGNAGWGDPNCGTDVRAAVDFWTDPPTVWLVPGGGSGSRGYGEGKHLDFNFRKAWDKSNIVLFQPKGGKLEVKRDFGKDVAKSVKRHKSSAGHQRLYVNPANRKLYVSENQHWVGGGDFTSLLEINPESGKVRERKIPVKYAEDLAFDLDGNAYFRQVNPHRVLRYDLKTWREIPWDYGEQGEDWGKKIISALPLPSAAMVCYSQGGLWVSPKGHLAVWCNVKSRKGQFDHLKRVGAPISRAKPYLPPTYPGRAGGCIHVWDKHGKLLYEDAVPGVSQTDGIAIDRDDNIYMLSWIPRMLDGKKYFNKITGTVIKVKAKKSKWHSNSKHCRLPLTKERRPDRHPDISGYTMGTVWIEGAEWLYGGVGNCSFKIATGCICWQQSRFTLDYFARSFAPEMDQFSVAVLDSAGNLIMRIGKYGNVDDGAPLSKNPKLAVPHPRKLGGDEVALMHACHVATMTDRYLYIGDVGNGRIAQVRLGYHSEEKVRIKDVPDEVKKGR